MKKDIDDSVSSKGNQSCGLIGILGAPNVGKSTLLNTLVGTKLSIVTPKVQTTRTSVIGVCIYGNVQLIFVDTPGVMTPRRRFEEAMVRAAWKGVMDTDRIVFMIDATKGLNKDTSRVLNRLQGMREKAVVAINKIDAVQKNSLLELAEALSVEDDFDRIFMISALSGDGVDDLQRYLALSAPSSSWLYPSDQLSDLPERMLAAEICREKIFLNLHQELPYAIMVAPESWKIQRDGSLRIGQVIYVLRASQRAIVLGKGGSTIRLIGESARHELESVLGRKVHLFLTVKVRPRWQDDPQYYREVGLEFPQ